MKRNAIGRIIIFSILIFILLGMLITGLGIGMFMVNFDAVDSGYATAQTSTVLFPYDEINNIEIEWASGNIDITTGDVDSIQVVESGSHSENSAMAYKQSGDTLYILYEEPGIQLGLFSFSDKDLTVTVPADWSCDNLKMDVASADVTLNTLTAKQVSIATASGDYQFKSCAIDDLDIDTASGSIEYEGMLNSLDCDAASGRFVGIFNNTPKSIEMDSASGDLDITLPADTGYLVSMDALSGAFQSDFGNGYVYGDGRCEIDFDGASANIRIRKGE